MKDFLLIVAFITGLLSVGLFAVLALMTWRAAPIIPEETLMLALIGLALGLTAGSMFALARRLLRRRP